MVVITECPVLAALIACILSPPFISATAIQSGLMVRVVSSSFTMSIFCLGSSENLVTRCTTLFSTFPSSSTAVRSNSRHPCSMVTIRLLYGTSPNIQLISVVFPEEVAPVIHMDTPWVKHMESRSSISPVAVPKPTNCSFVSFLGFTIRIDTASPFSLSMTPSPITVIRILLFKCPTTIVCALSKIMPDLCRSLRITSTA